MVLTLEVVERHKLAVIGFYFELVILWLVPVYVKVVALEGLGFSAAVCRSPLSGFRSLPERSEALYNIGIIAAGCSALPRAFAVIASSYDGS